LIDSRVTVIPHSQAALDAVDTKYFAFEHNFQDAPARFERQADTLDELGFDVGVLLSDVWPYNVIRPYRPLRFRQKLNSLSTRRHSIVAFWPETAMYRTDLAQMCPINDLVRYRPQADFFCRFYDDYIRDIDGITYLGEGLIYAPWESYAFVPMPAKIKFENPAGTVKVSILMPIYNRAYMLEDAINNVLEQTLTDWELIIIDDGSTDDPGLVVSSFKDPRIKFVRADNRVGQTVALNTALPIVCGEYIAIQDCDCRSLPTRLREQLDLDVDFACCELGVDTKSQTGNVNRVRAWTTRLPQAYHVPSFAPFGEHSTFLFKRELTVQQGFEFMLRMTSNTLLSIGKVRKVLIYEEPPSEDDPGGVAKRHSIRYINSTKWDIVAHYQKYREHTPIWEDAPVVIQA
jgi:hypothetical protein